MAVEVHLSRQVALAMKRKFIDIDRAIAHEEGVLINQTFEKSGI